MKGLDYQMTDLQKGILLGYKWRGH